MDLLVPFKNACRDIVGSDPLKVRDNIHLTNKQVRTLPTLSIQIHTSGIVLSDDPIKRLGLDPTQELGLAVSVDPKNPLNILLALPPAHYMEHRLRGGNNNDCGYFYMHVPFTKSSEGVFGANLMSGPDVVFDIENGRVGFAEINCDYNRAEEEK